ncbi:RIBOFLAVIN BIOSYNTHESIS PROTEIN RIBF [INCLUDES: RIBOFLAVIN KINASE (FLAVOKINASE); FMN ADENYLYLTRANSFERASE (FAD PYROPHOSPHORYLASE) (FAD SYNTHETASE)] [Mycoplasmopsis pulmonis]|uniref:FAD synthase n=1 Tax=Mycoplasmopsis pulmonis (strain UAB CTIP) TaxID=272635 RepID=Q98Q21_MYCPU|nr:hypothetical protein [Mycoplasmopsis pulmonis]CAC13721.1 RIBOFLAVIN BIOSYNTHESIS PROTEIN RIBF [INCLUDES: RIBOFLAVIN KINASE (FLAVOKINASE); FMN ADENYLYLTRANSFERASE (FAD PYROPHOSPHORYLASE) (FAD SYNTHETASE)] [Mycoplasmopsis pulmonis]VEU68313.1 riboflavin kinase [Mycoplasmopsis pulmonis]
MLEIYKFPKVFENEKICFIIGAFESFHIGHKKLFEKALEYSEKDFELVFVIVKNPADLPKNKAKNFLSFNSRIQSLVDFNLKKLVVWDFNEVSSLDGFDFIKKLVEKTSDFSIIVGEDFKLGKRASVNASDLKKHFQKVEIVEIETINSRKIATSLLKEQLEFGEIDFVNLLLIKNYEIEITINEKMLFDYPQTIQKIHKGIYFGFIVIDQKAIPCAIRIGFLENEVKSLIYEEIENLKNKAVVLEIVKKIRIITSSPKDNFDQEDLEKIKEFYRFRKK